MSDRRVSNSCRYIATLLGMLKVQLHYNPLIAGTIEILQVPLHFKLIP